MSIDVFDPSPKDAVVAFSEDLRAALNRATLQGMSSNTLYVALMFYANQQMKNIETEAAERVKIREQQESKEDGTRL